MSEHLYFGETREQPIGFETPLVSETKKALSTGSTLLSALCLILGSAAFITYFVLCYLNTSFFIIGALFLLFLLQGVFMLSLFSGAKRKVGFYKANSIIFLEIIQFIKLIGFVAANLYLLFFQYKRFLIIRYIRVKLFIPFLIGIGVIALAILISIISLIKIRSTVINNVPKKCGVVLSSVSCFFAGAFGILMFVGCFVCKYLTSILSRHILFPYSNYIIIPLGILFVSLYYIFSGVTFIKYLKAVKKESK